MNNQEREFEIIQDDMCVASASGNNALNEIKHYAAQYEQDGPIKVYEVIRREVNLAATSAASDAPGLPPLPEEKCLHWDNVSGYEADDMRAYAGVALDTLRKKAREELAAIKPAWQSMGCVRNPGIHTGEEAAMQNEIDDLRAALAEIGGEA